MAESDHLLWYLEKLNKKEFMRWKIHLGQKHVELGLPEIPTFDLRTTKEDLVNLLMTSYKAQHVWNMIFSVFEKLFRRALCEKINTRRNCELVGRVGGSF